MDEKDNSRSSLQTAADLGRATKRRNCRAAWNTIPAGSRFSRRPLRRNGALHSCGAGVAAAVSGVHGAAAAAVKETVPALVKFLLAVLLIMIVIPMVVFTALPNIFFGYDSSNTASVIHMTEQAKGRDYFS